jgi:tetratricopeptide (TPR) repeat protein
MAAMTAASSPFQLVLALGLLAVMTAACSQDDQTKDQRLARANDYFLAEQYEKAEPEYRNVLRASSAEGADPIGIGRLGIIYFEEGQLRKAFPLLKRATELQPDNLEVQLRLGLAYLSGQAYKEARETALQILEKQPGHQDALLLLVSTAVTPRDVEETVRLIESIRETDSDRPAYHLALGEIALRQNDPARAAAEFQAAQAFDPNSSAIHFAWGNLYWARKDLEKADQELKTASDLSPLHSFRRLHYVDFKLQIGTVAEAKTILEEIVAKAPDDLRPRVYLMKLACGERRNEDCATRIQSVLAQDATNYDALVSAGELDLAKNEPTKAVQEFEQLSKGYPRSAEVQYLLAVAYLRNSQDAKAVQDAVNSLILAVSLNPHFDEAALKLAELKIKSGQYAAAIDSLTKVIQERPQLRQAHLLLASAYLAQQNRDQAMAIYRGMQELFPQDPQPPFLIGMIQLGKGQQPDAREAFERSIEVSSDYLPALEKLVDLDITDKQYASALDRMQKQIDRNPKVAQLWAIRGKIYLAQRNFTAAETDLSMAIELDSALESAYIMLAGLYVGSNRQEQAIERLTAFTDKNKDVPALMQLATIHEQMKHYDIAGGVYERLLVVNPQFVPALNNLAYLYSERLGRPDAAYELAKRARLVLPEEPHIADTLGWILVKKGQYREALRLLQESASKLPDEPELQFHLGTALYMLGEEGPAGLALQKAAEVAKDFPGKDEARRRLSLLAIDVNRASPAARSELEVQLREMPSDPVALVRLAELQQRDGDVDQAVNTFERVVDDYPQFAAATRRFALLYGQRSADDRKAYDLLTNAHQAYPDDLELTKMLGILGYRRGSYPQSVDLLQKAAARLENDSDLLYYLGMAHYRLKQYAETKVALQQALRLNLSGKFADEASRALADCCQESK